MTKRARKASFAKYQADKRNWRRQAEWNEGLMRDLRRRKDALEEQLEDVRSVLGPHFIGLFPRLVDIRASPGPIRLPVMAPVPLSQHESVIHSAVLEPLEAETWRLRNQIHIRYTLKNREVGYAISEEALAQTPIDVLVKHLQQYIAHDMARMLVGAIRT